ncbi:MAG: hypothetical protein H6582_02915 [Crocinitomicaceae bacterium]|nr:hypothetical protein [Crocinitomicaceae bacterium]
MEFIFKYHPAWLLLATAVAFAYSYFLYRKDELLDDVKRSLKIILGVIRFTAVWLIFLLLLGIILENLLDRKEKPLVFIAHDNSGSIVLTKDSAFYKTDYLNQLNQLSENLQADYDVVNYSFSDAIQEGLEREYNGKMTNISQVFDQIIDQYSNRNIGAIVMSTDGIYNAGSNPVYSIARKSFLPIYTVGLGDTNLVRDLKIEFVKHNEIAFLGNDFPIDVILSQNKCADEKVKVGIYQGDKLIAEQAFELKGEEQQITASFTLKASSVGYQKYTARVTHLKNEFSLDNNEATFYVEVIDGRQKILIAHNGPHPDISAINYVIENNKNYEVDVKAMEEVQEVSKYDLIICHNYKPLSNPLQQEINSGGKPCLFLVGNQTDMNALSTAKIGVSGNRTDTEDVGFSVNTGFKDILLSANVIKMLQNAPPVQAPFGNINYSSSLDVLAYQKVGNIVLDKPLIFFSRKNTSKFGVIMGEGIWRWRLYDQMRNNSTANFEELISKLITYLAIKDNKDPFKVKVENEFNESENVIVKAELYNSSFELINEPEVTFKYTKEEGKTFESHFLKLGNAYSMDLGKLEQGIYNWEASTAFQGKSYKKSGTFLVREVKLEVLNTTANHRLLKSISESSGGKFFLPTQLTELEQDLKNRDDLVTVVYQEKSFDDLIDYKWLFFLIIILLGTEWFVRKFNGAY